MRCGRWDLEQLGWEWQKQEAAHSIEGGDSGDGKEHLNNREGEWERSPEVSQT